MPLGHLFVHMSIPEIKNFQSWIAACIMLLNGQQTSSIIDSCGLIQTGHANLCKYEKSLKSTYQNLLE